MIEPTNTTGRGVRSINQPPVTCRSEYGRRVHVATDPTKPTTEGRASGQSLPEPQLSSSALAAQHVDLVRQMALALRRRLAPGASIDDLVGAGNLGLVEATRRFDPSKASFGTFARYRIRGAMADSLRAIDPLSRQQRSRVKKVNCAIEDLTAALGRAPLTDEIAKHLGLSVDCWEQMSRELGGAISHGSKHATNQTTNPDDLPTTAPDPERRAASVRLSQLLHGVVGELTPRHQSVILLHYFSGWTMKRIAAEFGVTEGRASQIHRAALLELRTRLSWRNCGPGAI
jgi:RNA polymerase sigma factor for flagellar operon FliA